jgi:hypothetical protein
MVNSEKTGGKLENGKGREEKNPDTGRKETAKRKDKS